MRETRLLDTTAAARLLDISERTLERWRLEREGPPFIKLGKVVRYDLQDLEEYIAGARCTCGSGAEASGGAAA